MKATKLGYLGCACESVAAIGADCQGLPIRVMNEEDVSNFCLARLARADEFAEVILAEKMPAEGRGNDTMLRSVTAFAQGFAVCVWILPRQTPRNVKLVMHL